MKISITIRRPTYLHLILLLLCVPSLVFSQNRRFNALENFPVNNALDVIKDPYGFVWIAHDEGVLRYDGYDYVSFDIKDDNPNHIEQEAVWRLWIDQNKDLWIGGGNNGCARYDYLSESFKTYRYINNDSTKPLIEVRDFYDGSDSILWIASGKGLMYYNKEKDAVVPAEIKKPWSDIGEIHSLLVDQRGQVWIGTGNLNLYIYDPFKHSMKRYAHGRFKEKKDAIKFITDIIEDRQGNIWILGHTLAVRINPLTNKQDSFEHLLTDTQIPKNMAEDSEGNIWIASSGINIISPDLNIIEQCVRDNTGTTLRSISVNDIYFDDQGIVWVAAWNAGIDVNIRRKNYIKQYPVIQSDGNSLSHNVIHILHEDEVGNIWIGTDDGILNKYDPHSSQFTHYTDPGMIITEPITTILKGRKDGELLLGAWGGIKYFDTKTGNFERIKTDCNISCGVSFGKTKAYLQLINNSLFEFDLFAHTLKDPGKNFSSQCSEEILYSRQQYLDSHHNLWVVGWAGLLRYDMEEQCYHNLVLNNEDPFALPEGQVFCCLQDSKGRFWVGNTKGISLYNYEKDYFMTFGKQQGMEGTKVKAIQEDNNGNLWLATDKGMSKFLLPAIADRVDKDSTYLNVIPNNFLYFNNYNQDDGLIEGEFVKTSVLTKDGTIYLAGSKGMNSFKPEDIKPDTINAPIRFIELAIFNEPVLPQKKGSPLSKSIVLSDEIVLNPDQYFFTIKWAALNFYATNKIEYAYKLEGFDEEWNYIGKNRMATFTGLDPGNYTMFVKATNSDGLWDGGGTSIKITVLPPWYGTWWFRVLMFVSIIGTSIGFIYWRINDLEKQKLILIQKVDERTKELIEANATKDKFFSIIAHDLRNPFQTLLGYSDLLLSFYKEYKEKDFYDLLTKLNSVSNKTFNLLEDLLSWSRSQSGKINYTPNCIKVKTYVESNIALSKPVAKKKEISIVYTGKKDLSIFADINTSNVILRNLISNAIKFTDRKGTIQIDSQSVKVENKRFIKISVSDNGIGMTPEKIKMLFKISTMQSELGTDNETGSGLGLVLCKDFVKGNKGKIWVESELGKGSSFHFVLPECEKLED